MQTQTDIIQVNLDSLRFIQNYVKRPAVEAKRWIEHLQIKWGEEWRNHRFELRGVEQKVIKQLAFLELNLPLEVEKREDLYIVQNGTNTAYSYWQRGIKTIPAKLSENPFTGNRRIYTFNELRVEED